MTTIADLKNSLSRKFKGANIDDVQGVDNYSVFEEAAKNLLLKIDPQRTVRHQNINLFADILDYAPEADFREKIIDIRPQTGRTSSDNFSQTFTEDIDRDRFEGTFSTEYVDGEKLLRISKTLKGSLAVDDVSDAALWTGTATNISLDRDLYSEGSSSIRFDAGVGTTYVESSITSINLSDHEGRASEFRWVYLPNASQITSVELRLGNSNVVYFAIAGTLQYGVKKNGWNLYKFDWSQASETGSVDSSQIDYERVSIVSPAGAANVRIGKLSSKLPQPHTIVYPSQYIFKIAASGDWAEIPTVDEDTLMLTEEEEILFFYECCSLISSDMQNSDQTIKFDALLHGDGNDVGLYAKYETDHPNESMRPQTRFYRANRFHRRQRGASK